MYMSNAHHLHTSTKIIPVLPLHSLFSQTQGVSLTSYRSLPSLWWSIQSAPSQSGGAALLWKPWCVPEGMESYQAARYSKHMFASACRAVLFWNQFASLHTNISIYILAFLFKGRKHPNIRSKPLVSTKNIFSLLWLSKIVSADFYFSFNSKWSWSDSTVKWYCLWPGHKWLIKDNNPDNNASYIRNYPCPPGLWLSTKLYKEAE